MSERYAYILTITPKWWKRLCDQWKRGGRVHAFVRRGLVGPKKTELLFFYVTHRLKEIRGCGEFIERITGAPDDLWKTHGNETSLRSHKEYRSFLQGKHRATFIRFKGFRMLSKPVSAKAFFQLAGISRMPRGGRYLSEETAHELI